MNDGVAGPGSLDSGHTRTRLVPKECGGQSVRRQILRHAADIACHVRSERSDEHEARGVDEARDACEVSSSRRVCLSVREFPSLENTQALLQEPASALIAGRAFVVLCRWPFDGRAQEPTIERLGELAVEFDTELSSAGLGVLARQSAERYEPAVLDPRQPAQSQGQLEPRFEPRSSLLECSSQVIRHAHDMAVHLGVVAGHLRRGLLMGQFGVWGELATFPTIGPSRRRTSRLLVR